MQKRTHGFTLIELVVVMVIIGILASISVPIYRGYTRRAYASEGRALAGSIAQAEKTYYAEHNRFKNYALTASGDSDVSVDASTNKYFTAWTVTTGATAFTVTTSGISDANGITVQYIQSNMTSPGTLTSSGE